jgi:hypothetical protein
MIIPEQQVSPHVRKGKKSGAKKPARTTATPQRQGDRGSSDDVTGERRGVVLRYNDLKARGIVGNWPTLLRWIEREGFPPGFQLAANTRAWFEADVEAWLRSRPTCTSEAEPEGEGEDDA